MLERLLHRVPLWLLALIPALAAAILYAGPVLQSDFVSLDDSLLITKNPAVMEISGRSLKHIFTHYDPELYIPLTFLSYQIDDAIWGQDPVGFHLTNGLLHAASAALLALLAWKITGNRLLTILLGVLFAVHPLNVETVMWASARKDALSSFLAIASAVCFVQFREVQQRKWYRYALLLFILALLAKVSVVVLPVIFLLHDWLRDGRIEKSRWREYAPFFALAVLFFFIAIYGKSGVLESTGPLETFLFTCRSAVFYLQKLFWPSDLTVAYLQMAPASIFAPEFAIPIIILVFVLGLLGYLYKKHRIAAALLTVYFLFLLPNSTNFYKNGMRFFASDRYAYLAGIGILSLIAFGISRLDRRLESREQKAGSLVLAVALMAVITGLFSASVVQANTWRNSESMYRRVLSIYPRSLLALNNLGDVLMKADRKQEAMEKFNEAIAVDPNFISAHLNRGLALQGEGKIEEGLAELRIAVDLVEKKERIMHVEELGVYYFLGETLETAGKDPEEIIAVFRIAAERLPTASEPHYNLGLKLQKYRKNAEAEVEFLRAIEIEPLYVDAWYHLAGLQAEQGRLNDAVTSLETVLSINPAYPKAQEHLDAIRRLGGGV